VLKANAGYACKSLSDRHAWSTSSHGCTKACRKPKKLIMFYRTVQSLGIPFQTKIFLVESILATTL